MRKVRSGFYDPRRVYIQRLRWLRIHKDTGISNVGGDRFSSDDEKRIEDQIEGVG